MYESEAPSRDDGVGSAEDVFRRATFNWALSTKRMVESSQALGSSTKVAWSALADIEYARDLLDSLYVPVAGKSPAAVDGQSPVTATEVRNSVSDLASRIVTTTAVIFEPTPPEPPVLELPEPVVRSLVDQLQEAGFVSPDPDSGEGLFTQFVEDTPHRIDEVIAESRGSAPSKTKPSHRGVDLALPVWPKGGRMLWAGIDCTKCSSVAGQRCQKPDGTFMEKPHPPRDAQSKAMASVPEASGEKEDIAV